MPDYPRHRRMRFDVAFPIADVIGNPDAKRLYDDRLRKSEYNKLIRPVSNNLHQLTVKLGLRLSQLIDVVSGQYTTELWGTIYRGSIDILPPYIQKKHHYTPDNDVCDVTFFYLLRHRMTFSVNNYSTLMLIIIVTLLFTNIHTRLLFI